jgi:hypothetical protein
MLAFGKADAFNGFNQEIAKMPVKSPGNPVYFRIIFFGKR